MRAEHELLCPSNLHVDLFCNGKGIVDLNAQILHGAFDLPVAQQQLHGPQVAGPTVDQRRLGSAQRMSTEDMRVKTDAGDPLGLPGGHIALSSCPVAIGSGQ